MTENPINSRPPENEDRAPTQQQTDASPDEPRGSTTFFSALRKLLALTFGPDIKTKQRSNSWRQSALILGIFAVAFLLLKLLGSSYRLEFSSEGFRFAARDWRLEPTPREFCEFLRRTETSQPQRACFISGVPTIQQEGATCGAVAVAVLLMHHGFKVTDADAVIRSASQEDLQPYESTARYETAYHQYYCQTFQILDQYGERCRLPRGDRAQSERLLKLSLSSNLPVFAILDLNGEEVAKDSTTTRHAVVVIGYDDARQQVFYNTWGRVDVKPYDVFFSQWARTRHWAVVFRRR